jgi:AraC-like DNA-binding protein
MPARIVSGLAEVESAALVTWAAAIQVTECTAAELAPQLRALSVRYPMLPLVAIAPRNVDVLVHLLNSGVAETVWDDATPGTLFQTLSRLRGHGVLERVSALVERSEIIPLTLRKALAAAVRSPTPPRRVSDLAALAHCDRTTLWKHWRASLGTDHPLTPGRFLDWLILLHAVSRKQPGRKWERIADELKVHPHTLMRLSYRLTGASLRELAREDRCLLLARFEERVVQAFSTAGDRTPVHGNKMLLSKGLEPANL